MIRQMGDFGADDEVYMIHVVVAGDSLSKISKEWYGDYSHVQEIADLNGIANINNIKVGQVLKLKNPQIPEDMPIKPGPPHQSPILVPLPQPAPPTYDLPYTRPITLPAPPKEIPYTQPITLPALPPPTSGVPTPPAAYVPPKNISIMDFFRQVPTLAVKKFFGLTVLQWAAVTGLVGLSIGMLTLGSSRKTATNPRRKRNAIRRR